MPFLGLHSGKRILGLWSAQQAILFSYQSSAVLEMLPKFQLRAKRNIGFGARMHEERCELRLRTGFRHLVVCQFLSGTGEAHFSPGDFVQLQQKSLG